MVRGRERYRFADTAQQVVGGFLLAGAFVVTEEVWVLAANMSVFQVALTVLIVFAIGYGALYEADDRDPDREVDVAGVPVRFVSLIGVAYLSVLLLAVAFDAPRTFLGGSTDSTAELVYVTFKATSVGAVFSVVGAATADSVF
ncbi:MAG: DUF2391 family protein [Haloferacaceae archaeon]